MLINTCLDPRHFKRDIQEEESKDETKEDDFKTKDPYELILFFKS